MPHTYGIIPSEANLVQAARALAQETALPAAPAVDSDGRFPDDAARQLAEQGFFGLCLPREVGGQGQLPRVFAAVCEELAQACASTAMVYVMHVAASQAIAASTVFSRREALLSEIAAGKHLTTLAFSERGSRSQFWAPVSRLEEASGGTYRTSAHKSWVTSANRADSFVSSAQMPAASSPLESVLYLARRGQGVHVEGRFDGLGLRGNDSAPLCFDQLAISADELLTAPGSGAPMMLQVVLPWFAVGTAAMSNGLCRAAVALTASHLSNASFQHNQQRLCDLPTLRARLAEMSVRTEQSRALLGYTLASMQEPDEQTPLYVLQARLAAIETAVEVTELAMRACGGAAFSKHLGVERLFRDARAGWIMAPTADHLADFVGRALTGLPLF
jgi:alkylation response protein AidB-like acyl-CoA dehydrogenase